MCLVFPTPSEKTYHKCYSIKLQTDLPFMVVPYPERDEKACAKKARFNKKLRRGRVAVIECGLGSDISMKLTDSLAQI